MSGHDGTFPLAPVTRPRMVVHVSTTVVSAPSTDSTATATATETATETDPCGCVSTDPPSCEVPTGTIERSLVSEECEPSCIPSVLDESRKALSDECDLPIDCTTGVAGDRTSGRSLTADPSCEPTGDPCTCMTPPCPTVTTTVTAAPTIVTAPIETVTALLNGTQAVAVATECVTPTETVTITPPITIPEQTETP